VALAAGARVMTTSRSATMMVRSCDCADDGACTCITRPFGDDRPHLNAVAASSPDRVIELPSPLFRALARAGITRSEGLGDRLSEQQLATLMSRADSIATRIGLKQLCDLAGIMPKASR
jgi:hypothetical protein